MLSYSYLINYPTAKGATNMKKTLTTLLCVLLVLAFAASASAELPSFLDL